jgi:hypothetical protein
VRPRAWLCSSRAPHLSLTTIEGGPLFRASGFCERVGSKRSIPHALVVNYFELTGSGMKTEASSNPALRINQRREEPALTCPGAAAERSRRTGLTRLSREGRKPWRTWPARVVRARWGTRACFVKDANPGAPGETTS